MSGKPALLFFALHIYYIELIVRPPNMTSVGSRLFGERPSKEEAKKQREAQQA